MRSLLVVAFTLTMTIGLCRLLIPSQSPTDIGLFDNVECVTSCWQGLKPGQSSIDDVEEFYTINYDTFRTHSVAEELTSFSAIQNDGDYNVIVSFSEDVLVDIFLRVNSAPSFDLSIDTIVTILGNPEAIFVSYNIPVETSDIYPYINLYYSESGYIFQVDLDIAERGDNNIEVCVEPELNTSEIHVIAPNSISNVIIDSMYYTGIEVNPDRIDAIVDSLSQWTGYQCYTLSYPPNPVN